MKHPPVTPVLYYRGYVDQTNGLYAVNGRRRLILPEYQAQHRKSA